MGAVSNASAESSSSKRSAYNRMTLRFDNANAEAAFVESRHAKLCKATIFGSLLGLILNIASLASAFALDDIDSSPNGSKLSQTRIYVLASMAFMSIFTLIATTLSLNGACLKNTNFEVFLSGILVYAPFIFIVHHPWYLAKLLLIDNPRSVLLDPYKFNEDNILLSFDIWLTACHLMLPMRWMFLLPLEICSVIAYGAAAVGLGAQVGNIDLAQKMCLLVTLAISASWGKRALELHERTAFAQVAHERTLRYKAEHQLSRIKFDSKEKSRDADAVSRTTSLRTAEVFDLHVEACNEAKFEDIIACGLKEHWLIKPDDLHVVENGFLGSGGYGTVMIAHFHGAEVALKIPYGSKTSNTERMLKAIAMELRILRRLHHPNIVAFHGACVDLASEYIILVMEYVRGVPLKKACDCMASVPFAVAERWTWADNICAALVYLHAQSPSIIHGDIKDSNVLVEQGGVRRVAKLLDFGLSRLLTNQAVHVGGSLRWMAPEVIFKDHDAASAKIDVFSFGRLLHKIMTGQLPLCDLRALDIQDWTLRGSSPPLRWPDDMPLLKETQKLCDSCTRWTAITRPSMIDVQTSLREWWLIADLQDDLRDALRHAFPHQMSKSSLSSLLTESRNRYTDSCPSLVDPHQTARRQRVHAFSL
eukprot:TRINITY_DN11293_c0_g1_i4.p1 TRINITY_DN11293_c0_g1~~TRINITY_DN11293_c0_g1_i4.p1  ORF type:complete len:661 (+),score=66.49 TRINITY_DN11293_c0_g1_i4:42-1985(+)